MCSVVVRGAGVRTSLCEEGGRGRGCKVVTVSKRQKTSFVRTSGKGGQVRYWWRQVRR